MRILNLNLQFYRLVSLQTVKRAIDGASQIGGEKYIEAAWKELISYLRQNSHIINSS